MESHLGQATEKHPRSGQKTLLAIQNPLSILLQVWQGGLESINRGAGDPWQGQARRKQGQALASCKRLGVGAWHIICRVAVENAEVRGKIWWSDAVKYMAA